MDVVKCDICGFLNNLGLTTCKRCGTPLRNTQVGDDSGGDDESGKIRRGQLIANRYAVLDKVGQGGMGTIYRVKDNTLDEEVALKMLLPEYVQDQHVVERFFNEARIARSLSHANISRVHDIGSAEGMVYISMEYLRGLSLRQTLEHQLPGERIPVERVLEIFESLCSALAYAHEFTVHRDVKPENVMILDDGTVKLMDFGISKLMSHSNLTSASMVMGTPHYMSPEQLHNSANVDARADIYSVGVMLYEILTGRLPAGSSKSASQVGRGVPPAFDPIIEKCLEQKPEDRYASANELLEALEAIHSQYHKTGTFTPRRRPKMSMPDFGALGKVAGGIGLVLVLAATGLGLRQAEVHRAELIATANAAVPTVVTTAPGEITEAQLFEELEALRPTLSAAVTSAMDAVRGTYMEEVNTRLLTESKRHWDDAQTEYGRGKFDLALREAWSATHYSLATLNRPSGMFFVPPGPVTDAEEGAGSAEWVGGYFIDKKMVTVRNFRQYTREEPQWPWPEAAESLDRNSPMGHVTYFDAQAYAGSQSPPRLIATEYQWRHAISEARRRFRLVPLTFEMMPILPNVGSGNSSAPELEILEQVFAEAAESGDLRTNTEFWKELERKVDPLYVYEGLREWARPASDDDSPTFSMAMRICEGSLEGANEFRPMKSATQLYENASSRTGFRCVIELPMTVAGVRAALE